MTVRSRFDGRRPTARVLSGVPLAVAIAALLTACAQGLPSAASSASAGPLSPTDSAPAVPSASAASPAPTAAGSATSAPAPAQSAPVQPDPVPSSPVQPAPSHAPTTPATSGTDPLAALTGVPKGFTLPPGSKVARATRQASTSIVNLTAPDASISVPYLRAELTRLGYAQIVTKTSGSITAYGYKKGDSLVSLSGGDIGGLSLTAIIFATEGGGPADS